uniref:Uncharacterized protein n=1 Tax=Rhizophora mucronata TaxID=61149 RepID=A0A2P2R554_RHIMU
MFLGSHVGYQVQICSSGVAAIQGLKLDAPWQGKPIAPT